MPASFLLELRTAAETAKAAETSFRHKAARRIAALEQERAFAFRRLNLMQLIADAIASSESEDIAVASAFAALRMRLGWNPDSEMHSQVISHFAPVARAIFRDSSGDQSADIHAELASFEHWYCETRGSILWVLFEQQMPDTPVVDF